MKAVHKISIAVLLLLLIGGVFGYLNRGLIRDWLYRTSQPTLPLEETYQEQMDGADFPDIDELEERNNQRVDLPKEESIEEADEDVVQIPSEKLLAVPFTSQSPFKKWDELHEEACEEASMLMVAGYYRGDRGAYEPEVADPMILDLVAFEDEHGFGVDVTADEAAELVELYYPDLEAEVVPMTGPDIVKRYVARGIPVILPADGKMLPNPNFQNGGPVYHMLVVRGYTEDQFITNDPGTRLGENFLYTYDGLLDAVHDWNNGDVPNGEPVMLVIRKKVVES